METLKQHKLDKVQLESLHSGVNLRTDFEKDLERREKRVNIEEESVETKKERERKKTERILGIKLQAQKTKEEEELLMKPEKQTMGLNLFD